MVLKLYRGETCLRTIYNIHKISQGDLGMLFVVNKQDTVMVTTMYKFNKDYHRFVVTVD